MSLRDRDLISIQEARELAARAAAAQKKFAEFSQEQVDAIVEACAKAAAENAEPLARAAVEETGFGNVPDKIVKNTLAAVQVPRAIRGMRTVGILREDREKGIVEVASPIGVVAAVIPFHESHVDRDLQNADLHQSAKRDRVEPASLGDPMHLPAPPRCSNAPRSQRARPRD